MVRKKKPKPVSYEHVLEDPFAKLWEQVVSELPGINHLPLMRQVDVKSLVVFAGNQAITNQNIDFVCFPLRLSIEIQGATSKGRNGAHSSYQGLRRDYYKQWIMQMAGWTHLEFDADMSKDKELIKATIQTLTLKDYKVPNPTEFISWGRNKTQKNKLSRERTKLRKFLEKKSIVGTTTELAKTLKIRVNCVKPIMRELGWKQRKIDNKQVWVKH